MLIVLGEFDEAEVLLAECREEIELSGDTVYRPGPVIARASLRLAAGRLKEAQSDAEAGCSIAEHLGARRFVPGRTSAGVDRAVQGQRGRGERPHRGG